MGLMQFLKMGGFTIYVLLICSIVSLAIIIQRLIYYRQRSKIKRVKFMMSVCEELSAGDIEKALCICEKTDAPFSTVVAAGLRLYKHSEMIISNTMEREIAIETNKLEKYISVIGTMGSTAVYIGLFGTVLGIIKAFQDIALNGSGGISVVINGVAEALVCTAAGLAVAIPAVIAYNYFVKKIDNFITDMELCVSETLDLITIKQK